MLRSFWEKCLRQKLKEDIVEYGLEQEAVVMFNKKEQVKDYLIELVEKKDLSEIVEAHKLNLHEIQQ